MKTISKGDYYQVRWMGETRLVDEDSLRELYLPLLKTSGYALYQTLRHEEGTQPAKHLLLRLDLSSGEFTKALAPLEAVGLVRTFAEPHEGASLFVYCLYAPKTVREFFNDFLLLGTLRGMIGDDAYSALAARYQAKADLPDAEEISCSFPSVFDQSYPQEYYLQKSPLSAKGRKAKERLRFDRGTFLKKASTLGLRTDLFSEAELDSIEKIATLYTINEDTMAEFVYSSIVYNAPRGKKVDMDSLSEKCRAAMPFKYLQKEEGASSKIDGNSNMASKIRLMDSATPSKYLSIRQNYHKPADPDLKLIQKLSVEIGLSDPCINALIDYVLDVNDNILSASYCEKLAASMVREGCRSAKDAMDYLLRNHKRSKRPTRKIEEKAPEEPVKPKAAVPHDEDDEEFSDEEVKAMLDKLYNGK